ncbi:hypothetical protein C8J57DRAFT_1524612 [Mycena rebaudengoi]|nr:hypothetical protein C8J57DRAFT_1524612 [Mycena rebaudengoi]
MSAFVSVDSVTLQYKGTTPLGDTITIPKSDGAYEFKAYGATIANIHNRNDVDKVEMGGGNAVNGTRPFTVTVDFK